MGTIVHQEIINLPTPSYNSQTSIEEALLQRRSVREYSNESLSLKDISQLLWAAQGITSDEGGRTAPSAGALYPLEIYLVCRNIQSLPRAIYHYNPVDHTLESSASDPGRSLSGAALGQEAVRDAPAVLLITADYGRTTGKYHERGKRYVHLEAGHAAQNICLQAVSLNIGTVVIGAFSDSEVKKVTVLPEKLEPLYLIPFGRKR